MLTGLAYKTYFLTFPCEDYCLSSGDASIYAEHIAEVVVVAGMEAYM